MNGLEYGVIGFVLGALLTRTRPMRRYDAWAARKGTEHADRLVAYLRRRKDSDDG